MGEVYRKGPIELRLGDYRDVLADVEPDAVITDPPYSERTHAGMKMNAASGSVGGVFGRGGVVYDSWSAGDIERLVSSFSQVRWIVAMTDDVMCHEYREAARSAGRYAFPPLPFVELGKQPRLGGDGPAGWTCWIMPSRISSAQMLGWGSLPGAYVTSTAEKRAIKGGKPIALMRALVRDYSRPGDLVCDPCAGGATTLIAAALEGRRAIGAELDPKTFALACARIERTALTAPLPGMEPRRKVEQGALALDEAAS